jgi:hypothetical protein
MNTGYIYKPHEPEHKVFGSANEIGGAKINPGGHWLPWIPLQDQQQNEGIEPENCTSEGTLNAVETLANLQYGDTTEWSKRFLAYISGTTQSGNDPMTVALTLQSKGTVPEINWPNSSTLTTWEQFYATPPQNLYTKALEFIALYDFHKEWVPTDIPSLLAALEYSPLGVAGWAWTQDPTTGYYITPPGVQPCHWFVIIDYVENEYWVIFDSYEQDVKKVAWNYTFNEAMRYSLIKNVANTPTAQSAWSAFKEWMNKILHLGEYSAERLGGATRSSQWPAVRTTHLKQFPNCAICGGNKKITVHHRRPFHLHPELELDPTNLITLCEGAGTGNHHLLYGHWGNYTTKYNPSIDVDTAKWFPRLTAKIEDESL